MEKQSDLRLVALPELATVARLADMAFTIVIHCGLVSPTRLVQGLVTALIAGIPRQARPRDERTPSVEVVREFLKGALLVHALHSHVAPASPTAIRRPRVAGGGIAAVGGYWLHAGRATRRAPRRAPRRVPRRASRRAPRIESGVGTLAGHTKRARCAP